MAGHHAMPAALLFIYSNGRRQSSSQKWPEVKISAAIYAPNFEEVRSHIASGLSVEYPIIANMHARILVFYLWIRVIINQKLIFLA